MSDLPIIDELREAADRFESAEFHDDMPIKEAPDLLRRAAKLIEYLRETLEAYGR